MKYYRIRFSLNEKEIGKYAQVKNTIYEFDVKDERFIENIKWHLKRIDFDPLIPVLELWPKAKITDLISVSSMGVSEGLVISNKLKRIIEGHSYSDVQFFPINVFKGGRSIGEYWHMRYSNVSLKNIDFNISEIWEVEHTFNKIKQQNINDNQNFLMLNKSMVYPRSLQILKIRLRNNIPFDSFALNFIEGGIGYFVSEKLKNAIENAGCTGIVFTEPNEKYP